MTAPIPGLLGILVAKSADSGGSLVTQNPIGYTGALTDTYTSGSTGYVHDGARWYNPATGIFTSQDTNSYLANPANGNRYACAADNPANYPDPTGHSCASALEASAAAVLLDGNAEFGIWATAAILSEEELAVIEGGTALEVVSGGIGAIVAGVIVGSVLLGC